MTDARAISPTTWVRLTLFTNSVTQSRAYHELVQPKTLVFGARLLNDYRSASQHTQAPIAFSAQNLSLEAIMTQAKSLVRAFFRARISPHVDTSTKIGTVTNLSLSFEGIEAPQMGQQDIQTFFSRPGTESPVKARKLHRHASARGSASLSDLIDLTKEEEVITIDSDTD